MFGRKRKDDRPAEERAEEAQEFVEHLVMVSTSAILDGSEEARDIALAHISTDIRGASKDLLERALGSVVIAEGNAQAQHVRAQAESFLSDLLGKFRGEPQDAAGAPTDLLPDEEAPTAPQAADAAPVADEKVWDEDRR